MFSTCPSVRSLVTKLVSTILCKPINRFRCQLALLVHGAKARNGQLWWSGGQRSRSHEAKVSFGGLAEASFSVSRPPLGRVAFLVWFCYVW